MADQNLTLHAEASGFDQAAAQVEKITDAQYAHALAILTAKDATDEQVASAKKLAETYQAQQQAQANTIKGLGDFTSLLNQALPGLGGWIRNIQSAARAAGVLGQSQTGLKDLFGQVTGAIGKNSSALLLLGAGGLVVAAIASITSALGKMREESERVTQAIKDQVTALNELKKTEGEQKQSVEDLRDKSRSGPFSAEQSRAAADTRARLKQRPELGFLSDESINAALAASGGASDAAGGGAFGLDQIANLAVLTQSGKFEFDPNRSQEGNRKAIDRAFGRFAPQAQAIRDREARQSKDAQAAAQSQTTSQGSSNEIDAFIARFARPGANIEAIREGVRQFGTSSALDAFESGPRQVTSPGPFGEQIPGTRVLPKGLDVEDLPTVRAVLTEVEALNKKSRGTAAPANVTNIYNQQNARNVGADAHSQARRSRNGENTNGQF